MGYGGEARKFFARGFSLAAVPGERGLAGEGMQKPRTVHRASLT